jgi:hypothetical protein
MHILRILRDIARVCWQLFALLAAISSCVALFALFVTLLAQAMQPGPEEHQLAQQRIVQEEAAEKAKVAERCAYLTSGTFTEATFKEFTDYQSVLWMKANDPRGAFQGFVEDQCKWPQDFLAKAAAMYFDKYRHRKEIEADWRPPKPREAEIPAGWVIEDPVTVSQPQKERPTY